PGHPRRGKTGRATMREPGLSLFPVVMTAENRDVSKSLRDNRASRGARARTKPPQDRRVTLQPRYPTNPARPTSAKHQSVHYLVRGHPRPTPDNPPRKPKGLLPDRNPRRQPFRVDLLKRPLPRQRLPWGVNVH